MLTSHICYSLLVWGGGGLRCCTHTLTKTNTQACQECAKFLNIADSAVDLKRYTSTAVRRGVGAQVAKDVKDVMQGMNKATGVVLYSTVCECSL